MTLDTSRHHAMAISSLVKEETENENHPPNAYLASDYIRLPPVMSPSLSSTSTRSSGRCYVSAPRSPSSSSSLFDDTTTGELLLDTSSRSQSSEERRRRNKEASARYRAKRNQRNEDMRNVVAKLIHQNNVLFAALQEAYHHQGREAPRSMDDVLVSMNKTEQENYIRNPSIPPASSYPSPPLGQTYMNRNFYPSTSIS